MYLYLLLNVGRTSSLWLVKVFKKTFKTLDVLSQITEAYSEPYQASMMERFCENS